MNLHNASWRGRVWGHFCLSYGDVKLITDTDLIKKYGIKDDDQVCPMFPLLLQHCLISYFCPTIKCANLCSFFPLQLHFTRHISTRVQKVKQTVPHDHSYM